MAAQPPTQHTEETHQNCFGYIILISSIPYKSWIFLVKRKEMAQLSNYTACLCVIKETCSVCSPGRESHSSTGTSSGTANGSKADQSPRKLFHLYCLWLQSVLPSSWSIKCSLQKCKWLTASRALYTCPKHLFPHCTSLLFKAMSLEKHHENNSETFSLNIASITPLIDWHDLLNQISS